MPPGRRQKGGCWTCRLRHKRCNSIRPVCENCQSLDISCCSDDAKPSWMDGGAAQRQMSETIKRKIKQSAQVRREKRAHTYEQHDTLIALETNQRPQADVVPDPGAGMTGSTREPTHDYSSGDPRARVFPTSSTRLAAPSSSAHQSEGYQLAAATSQLMFDPVASHSENSSRSSWLAGSATPIPLHLGSVMIYLDYVFPFIFPFYHPSLMETGRQWVLGMLCQNEVFFHLAASLSAYFFSLTSQNDNPDTHEDCKTLVWIRLVEQMDMAIKSVQTTVSAVKQEGALRPVLDHIRVMEEIIQLLMVEVTVRRNVDWKIHLTPALTLFDEVFQSHGIENMEPSLAALLRALPTPYPVVTPPHKPLPNTADQSALVFFVSLLLFIDIVGSTSLERPPVLQKYHERLLLPNIGGKCSVQLESIIGCENWVLVAIGEISALCAWKRAAKQSGNYSVLDLVKVAVPISQALEEGVARLEAEATRSSQRPSILRNPLKSYGRHDSISDRASTANVTLIWAYAAKVYLSVSLSGWQMNSTETQSAISKLLSSLQTINSPARLRSLSWPICVAGCLAVPSQEYELRRTIGNLSYLSDFGTLRTAQHIMEAVWCTRNAINEAVWDIASSLNILDSPALLL